MGQHFVSKCKDDEFEGIAYRCVTNFRFMEESLDVPWPCCIILFTLKNMKIIL